MNNKYDQIGDEMIIRYLLGQLSIDEEESIDEALVHDEFYARVSAIEEELIDDYAQDKLPMETRILVEGNLLTDSERLEQLSHSTALFGAVRQFRFEESLDQSIVDFSAVPRTIGRIEDEQIKDYLLGRLPAQSEEMLDLAMVDDGFFSRVSGIEEDLIDDYAQGHFSDDEKQLIEQRLLKTEGQRELLDHSRALFAAIGEIKKQETAELPVAAREGSSLWDRFLELFRFPTPILAAGMAAAALLIFAGGAWFAYESWKLRGQPGQIAQLREREQSLVSENNDLRSNNQRKQEQVDRATEQLTRAQTENEKLQELYNRAQEKRGTTYFTAGGFSIAATEGIVPRVRGGDRGGETRIVVPGEIKLTLKKDSALALLKLLITNDNNPGYSILLSAESGLPVLRMNGLKAKSSDGDNQLRLSFPADLLSPGKYTLEVTGTSNQRAWVFSIVVE